MVVTLSDGHQSGLASSSNERRTACKNLKQYYRTVFKKCGLRLFEPAMVGTLGEPKCPWTLTDSGGSNEDGLFWKKCQVFGGYIGRGMSRCSIPLSGTSGWNGSSCFPWELIYSRDACVCDSIYQRTGWRKWNPEVFLQFLRKNLQCFGHIIKFAEVLIFLSEVTWENALIFSHMLEIVGFPVSAFQNYGLKRPRQHKETLEYPLSVPKRDTQITFFSDAPHWILDPKCHSNVKCLKLFSWAYDTRN